MSNVISDSVGSVAGWWTNTFGEGAGATAKGQALDAQLAAMNQRDYAPGGVIYQQIEDTQGPAAADAAYAADQTNLANPGERHGQVQRSGHYRCPARRCRWIE